MKVLVTSASRKLPLLDAISAQLPAACVIASDYAGDCLAAYAWPEFMALPDLATADPRTLADAIADAGINLLIPTRDPDVTYFAEHVALYAARGLSIMAPHSAAAHVCTDKIAFADLLERHAFPGIPTYLASDDIPLDPCTRVVLKERAGTGSVGLRADVDLVTAQRVAGELDEPIIQPFIEGRELSIDAYRSRDGRVLGVVARTRDFIVAGEAQVTTTVDPAPYLRITESLLQCLDVHGHAIVQVKDASEGIRIIECNPRLGSASSLSLSVGLQSLVWFALEAEGRDPAEVLFEPQPPGVRLVRRPKDTFNLVGAR